MLINYNFVIELCELKNKNRFLIIIEINIVGLFSSGRKDYHNRFFLLIKRKYMQKTNQTNYPMQFEGFSAIFLLLIYINEKV